MLQKNTEISLCLNSNKQSHLGHQDVDTISLDGFQVGNGNFRQESFIHFIPSMGLAYYGIFTYTPED